jgi:hypothetical protein
MKNIALNPILKISSTIVIPFLLALLSRYFRVKGGCAAYCIASRIIVVMAAVERVSALAVIVDAADAVAPPMIDRGDVECRIVLLPTVLIMPDEGVEAFERMETGRK